MRNVLTSSYVVSRDADINYACRWLTARGRFDEARRSVALARGIPESEADKHLFIHREVSAGVFSVQAFEFLKQPV